MLIWNLERENREISKVPPGSDIIIITVIVTGANLFATHNVPRFYICIFYTLTYVFLTIYKVTLSHFKGETEAQRS